MRTSISVLEERARDHRAALVHRCRRCGTRVAPRTEAHAVAWCGVCHRVGIAVVSVAAGPLDPA